MRTTNPDCSIASARQHPDGARVTARRAPSLVVIAVLSCGALAGCGRGNNDVLRLDYQCEFNTPAAGNSFWSKDELELGINIDLGSGRATVDNGESSIEVQPTPDAGKLLLRVPDELGRERKVVIWPDGKAVLTEMTGPASRETRDFQGSCDRD